MNSVVLSPSVENFITLALMITGIVIVAGFIRSRM